MKKVSLLRKGELSINNLFEEAWRSPQIRKAGAVASFFGIVRGGTYQNEPVRSLKLEAYETLAEKNFEKIADDIKNKYRVFEVFIHHVTGRLDIGDPIMAIIVLGASRKTVFPALEEVVERVKKEALIWKNETLESGESHWIEYKE